MNEIITNNKISAKAYLYVIPSYFFMSFIEVLMFAFITAVILTRRMMMINAYENI